MRLHPHQAILLLLLALPAAVPALAEADPEAAREQYRLARRLAAEGSAEAREALGRVVTLDPDGELADDALVEQAGLDVPAGWPESVGGLDAAAVTRAIELLDEAVDRLPGGDRIHEALYLRALFHLEAAPSFDPSAARVDLTRVATARSVWAARARHGLGWLLERAGEDDRAYDAYQRLLVDASTSEVAARSRVGLARVLLRRGNPGRAARLLQEAIDTEVAADVGAASLRELAVRSLLRDAGAGDRSRADRTPTGIRSLDAFATTAGGGVLLGDRKRQRVLELDAAGGRVADWAVEEVQALTTDGNGRRFVAAGSQLYRLEIGRPPRALASLADFAPVSALATDGTGGFWLLERRGKRIGRIEPGSGVPVPFWEGEQLRLSGLVWSGSRLVALDARARGIVAIDRSGRLTPLVERDATKSMALAADPAGRVALLDGKSGTVRFLGVDGKLEAAAFATTEVARPRAVGLGSEGELHLFDDNGDWVVFR